MLMFMFISRNYIRDHTKNENNACMANEHLKRTLRGGYNSVDEKRRINAAIRSSISSIYTIWIEAAVDTYGDNTFQQRGGQHGNVSYYSTMMIITE